MGLAGGRGLQGRSDPLHSSNPRESKLVRGNRTALVCGWLGSRITHTEEGWLVPTDRELRGPKSWYCAGIPCVWSMAARSNPGRRIGGMGRGSCNGLRDEVGNANDAAVSLQKPLYSAVPSGTGRCLVQYPALAAARLRAGLLSAVPLRALVQLLWSTATENARHEAKPYASSTSSSASRLASSSRRRPSISRPWVERVVVVWLDAPLKSIWKLPLVQVRTL